MLWFWKAGNWPGILPYRRQAKDWWAWKPASPFIHLAPGILNYSLPTISTAAVILLLLRLLWRADAIPGSLYTHYYTITVTITRTIGVLRLRWHECSYQRRTMAGAERKEATTESLDTCRSRNSPILTFTFVDFLFCFPLFFWQCECKFWILPVSVNVMFWGQAIKCRNQWLANERTSVTPRKYFYHATAVNLHNFCTAK